MKFTKMHGAGNDYVFVDCFDEPLPANAALVAKLVSDRHTGIGSDGLILIASSENADARMIMHNADGTLAEMCGNGIRCVGKYLYDHGRVLKQELEIETDSGVLSIQLETYHGKVHQARVNMGTPVLEASRIPTSLNGNPPVLVPLTVNGKQLEVTCVSMGNPHCVLFCDELLDETINTLGPLIEQHAAFPERINVEFAQRISPNEVNVRVWERGCGETQACGTGASAVAVAGVLAGRTNRQLTCHLSGGTLQLEWRESGEVFMTGPAVEVFSGEWHLPKVASVAA
ncbi:MAG: diaminopimelate epimerase [Planctomycetaceae bacterium]|nr:diaminopimelate epimerase [Planctomycetaceae bacterium]